MKVTGVPGLPIATDGDKGTYYLPFAQLRDGRKVPLLLRTPNKKADVEIAASIEEFMKF